MSRVAGSHLIPPPRPVSMDGAKSVFCQRTGPSRITDHPSIEEARSVPVPCGPECRGVHYVVSTEGGKFVITGTGPPRPPLADELLALSACAAPTNSVYRRPGLGRSVKLCAARGPIAGHPSFAAQWASAF
jgi:hypothetical protein